MSQIGNKCPGLNEYHTFASGDCLNACPHGQCMPASVLAHIERKLGSDKHTGEYISVTSLLGCLRQLYLMRTIDYYVEPPKSWWMLRGKILHHLLEQAPEDKVIPNWIPETEYVYDTGVWFCQDCGSTWTDTVDGIKIHLSNVCTVCGSSNIVEAKLYGTIDVLRPETGELYDYKTVGDNGLMFLKNGLKDDHIMQFNMYRLMVERGQPRHKFPTNPIKIKKIVAFYMTMMQVVKTGGLMTEVTEWRVSDPPNHSAMMGVPELLDQKQYLKLKKGKKKDNAKPEDYELQTGKKFRITYQIPEVPLLDLDSVHNFIQETVPILLKAFKFGTMPPMCPPAMREWKCDNYCPDQIRNACDAYNLITGEKRVVEVTSNEIPIEKEKI